MDKDQLLHLKEQSQNEGTCQPTCNTGECCVRVGLAVTSRKRAVGGDLLGGSRLPGGIGGGSLFRRFCQPLKQQGEKCLLRNQQQEWCDCAPGLTCTFSETAFLNNFFGVCQ